ncbi:hypothetical protein, partial [Roseobacter weihaiensis]|uniref:hypothetical protein n=1 Tax=Roseobacter weihaiensis TaxID=2763262 RepID=UPI001D0AFB68
NSDACSISGAPHKITIDEPGRPQRSQLNRTTSFDDGHVSVESDDTFGGRLMRMVSLWISD